MGWNEAKQDIQWAAASTKSVLAAADEPSDDITLTTGPWERSIMVKVDNAVTPAATDEIEFYWQAKGDPDNDAVLEYTKQGTFLGVATTFGTDDFGDPLDGSSKMLYLNNPGSMTGRLVAVSNASANAITVSAQLTEITYTV